MFDGQVLIASQSRSLTPLLDNLFAPLSATVTVTSASRTYRTVPYARRRFSALTVTSIHETSPLLVRKLNRHLIRTHNSKIWLVTGHLGKVTKGKVDYHIPRLEHWVFVYLKKKKQRSFRLRQVRPSDSSHYSHTTRSVLR